MTSKICKKCLVEKSLPEFTLAKQCKDGYRNECKVCRSVAEKARDKSHRVTVTYEYKRESRFIRLYGITLKDYDKMLEDQGGVCVICKSSSPGWNRESVFSVDHDHKTGVVRGLLCHFCNSLLGQAKDDTLVLGNAITYLNEHQKRAE